MKKMNYIFWTLLFVYATSTQLVHSQTWTRVDRNRYEAILKPTADFLASEDFSYKVNYKSFIGHNGINPVEEMKGIYTRRKGNFYCNMPGNLSIQNGDIRVQVDTIERIVVLLPPDDKLNHDSWEWAYEEMMSQATAIEESVINGRGVLRLLLGKGHELEEQRFYFGEDKMLDRIVMYYRAMLPIDPSKQDSAKEKARLEIHFSNWSSSMDVPNKWNLENIISMSKKNVQLLGRFQKYELVEFR
jgi:hypothetical protein